MLMNPFARSGDPYGLVVSMTGVKMGERMAHIGCAQGGRLAAIARKVGLSGLAIAFVPDEASAARARKGAADAGVLVEVETAPPTRVPADDAAFDLVVVDDTAGLVGTMSARDRIATIREALRILRPGGRVIVLGYAPRGSLGGLLTRVPSGPPFDPEPGLRADGFRSVRRLAERDGLVFVEGIKPGVGG
jgi:ubiquinone/menaquinone biosynthesis C-methylase UbiE